MTQLEQRRVHGLPFPVPVIGAGCWTIGGAAHNNGVPIGWDGVDPEAACAGLVKAYELGVRLFDTADVYGMGQSERHLGRLLGSFVEFEFTGQANGPEDAAAQLDKFIADLDIPLGDPINRGYPHMMLGREH